jgi:hypothetical protein
MMMVAVAIIATSILSIMVHAGDASPSSSSDSLETSAANGSFACQQTLLSELLINCLICSLCC